MFDNLLIFSYKGQLQFEILK